MSEVMHRIQRPYVPGEIEVYGEAGAIWYEWRILDGKGNVLHDSGRPGHSGEGGHGSPGIALRNALNHDQPPRRPFDAMEFLAREERSASLVVYADDLGRLAVALERQGLPAEAGQARNIAKSLSRVSRELEEGGSHE